MIMCKPFLVQKNWLLVYRPFYAVERKAEPDANDSFRIDKGTAKNLPTKSLSLTPTEFSPT